jgi:TonB family protein
MFEALSGSSQSKNSRRPIAVLTAVGLHAAVIGTFLLSPAHKAVVENEVIFDGPIHQPTRHGPVATDSGRPGPKPKPQPSTNSNIHRPTHMKPPREMVADETPPDPIAPDPIPAPESGEHDANPSNILPGNGNGLGDAGDPDGEGPGAPCPAGAICRNQGGEQILSFNSALSRPHARCTPPSPSAPYAAREIGLDGRVVAQFIIHADGRADSVSVLNSDAPPVFAQAVRDWIEQCGFEPAQLNGLPYSVRMTQVFRFERK